MINSPLPQLNSNPQTAPNGALMSDSDRATSVLGFNPNQYVYGDNGSFNQTSQPQAPAQNNQKQKVLNSNKTSSGFLGALVLAAVGIVGALSFKVATGKEIKMPDFRKFFGNLKDACGAFAEQIKK